jgi:hypothetical protein
MLGKMEPTMKIYRYNTETGVYLGEDFADKRSMEVGEYDMPDDATTIPPPEVNRGEVPIFNPETGGWEIERQERERVVSDISSRWQSVVEHRGTDTPIPPIELNGYRVGTI